MTERCRYCKESFGLHLLRCPSNVSAVASAKTSTPAKSLARQRGRVPREDYLNAVTVTTEHERTVANERQRRYRERNRDAINEARRADNWGRPKGRPLGRPKKSA